jgi:hypothetical protein
VAPIIVQQSHPAAQRQGWQIVAALAAVAVAVVVLVSLSVSAVPTVGTGTTHGESDPVLDTLMAETPAWVARAEVAPPTAEQRATARKAAAEPTRRPARNLTEVGRATPAEGISVLDGDPETYWTGHRLVVAFSAPVKAGQVTVSSFGPSPKKVRVNGSGAVDVDPEGETTLDVEGGTIKTVDLWTVGWEGTLIPNGVRDLLVY